MTMQNGIVNEYSRSSLERLHILPDNALSKLGGWGGGSLLIHGVGETVLNCRSLYQKNIGWTAFMPVVSQKCSLYVST